MKYYDNMYQSLKGEVSSWKLMGALLEGIMKEGKLHKRFYVQGCGGQPSIKIQKITVRHVMCVK